MSIYAISDIHVDFEENYQLMQKLDDQKYQGDALILAGDVATDWKLLKESLLILKQKFKHLFYVPGNHELWVVNKRDLANSLKDGGKGKEAVLAEGDANSWDKFQKIVEFCKGEGIHTEPEQVAGVWVFPLFSWYDDSLLHESLVKEKHEDLKGWGDYHLCHWPFEATEVSQKFSALNQKVIDRFFQAHKVEIQQKSHDFKVITFSHFLPLGQLLPPPQYLRFPSLSKVSGSLLLENQIRELHSFCHIFGHSHINLNREIDGIRYVQNAMGYPHRSGEGHGKHQSFPLLKIYER